jgi:hypothetical protein
MRKLYDVPTHVTATVDLDRPDPIEIMAAGAGRLSAAR